MRRRTTIAAASAAGATLVVALGIAPAGAVEPADFEDRVTTAAVMAHLQALQDVADANGGNRATGTSGYEASAQYIESTLAAAGYTTQRQYFDVDSQTIDAYALSVDGLTGDVGIPMEFTPGTPAGGLTDLELIAPPAPLGCTADDWAGTDATGKIALVSRGDCAFGDKSIAAAGAGAAAILVYNNEDGPLDGTLGEQAPEMVPAVGIEQAQGEALLAALANGPVTADLTIEQHIDTVETFNVIADSPTGRTDNTVMLGAHLDSVPEGPGINDNGSGSAAILEIAVQLAASGPLENQVRFAWWGAEEIGLVGSYHYVDDLDANNPQELEEIATYLNFDMVASPNPVIAVYDANESTYPAPPGVVIPEGSVQTEAAFTDYFDSIGQPWVDTAFDARSDYDGFISAGVPASGLFTGADEIKSDDEVALFGGTAGIPMDPNYHTAADDISNIDENALGIMLGAMAHVTASLANDTSAINGVGPSVPTAPQPAPGTEERPDHLAASGPADIGGWALAATVLVLLGAGGVLATRRRA